MLGFRNLGAGPEAKVHQAPQHPPHPISAVCVLLWFCVAHVSRMAFTPHFLFLVLWRSARAVSHQKPVNGGVATDRAAKAFPPDHMGPVPISTMDLHCHFDTQGNKVIWVFTGDEQGMVKLWDITPFANHLPINPLPEEKQPCNLGSYNPRMRLRRVFAGVDHGGITAKERP
mgnify:CR=1 FL=1